MNLNDSVWMQCVFCFLAQTSLHTEHKPAVIHDSSINLSLYKHYFKNVNCSLFLPWSQFSSSVCAVLSLWSWISSASARLSVERGAHKRYAVWSVTDGSHLMYVISESVISAGRKSRLGSAVLKVSYKSHRPLHELFVQWISFDCKWDLKKNII